MGDVPEAQRHRQRAFHDRLLSDDDKGWRPDNPCALGVLLARSTRLGHGPEGVWTRNPEAVANEGRLLHMRFELAGGVWHHDIPWWLQAAESEGGRPIERCGWGACHALH